MEDLGDMAEKTQKSGNLAGNLDARPGNLDLCIGIVSENGQLRYMTDAERAEWQRTRRVSDQLVVIVPPCPDDIHPTDRSQLDDASRSNANGTNEITKR